MEPDKTERNQPYHGLRRTSDWKHFPHGDSVWSCLNNTTTSSTSDTTTTTTTNNNNNSNDHHQNGILRRVEPHTQNAGGGHVRWGPDVAHSHSHHHWLGFGSLLRRWSIHRDELGGVNGTGGGHGHSAPSHHHWPWFGSLLRRWSSHREELSVSGTDGGHSPPPHHHHSHSGHKTKSGHVWRRWGSHRERPTRQKEHSLASVDLASWSSRASSRRGSALPLPFCAGLSPVEAARKAEVFETVQTAIVKLFQHKPLQENELGMLQENVRSLADAEAGSLIYDYYKDQLLKKGMVILREKIKNEQGAELMEMLGDTWDYFFTEILPTLQAIMYPLALQGFDIRSTTLLEFRNIVVLKVSLREALDAKKYEVPPNIRQMLLILQGLHDDVFLSENQFRCEKLVARVVVPYLGQRGLYEGSPEPVTRANFRPPLPKQVAKVPKLVVTEENTADSPDLPRSLKLDHMPLASPLGLRKLHEPSSSHGMHRLKPVLEHVYDVGRRHSLIS